MNSVIRFWNLNRKKIIIIGWIVVFFILIVQVSNQIIKKQNESTNKNNNINNIVIEEKLPTEPIISGSKVSEKTTKNNTQIIEEFISNCNNGNIEGAYNLLTQKCKEILFPNQETFKTNYYDIIFKEKRIYNIENWISNNKLNTYRIEYFSDVMATGKIEQAIDFQDYITIDEKENNKININSFIGYKQIDKENKNDKVEVKVIGKQVFKDFELYEIEVQNKTSKTILLDTQNKSNTILLKANNTEYGAYLGDLSWAELIINANQNIKYWVKFNKTYTSLNDMKEINFTDIVEDYELYMQDKQNYKERTSLVVNLQK